MAREAAREHHKLRDLEARSEPSDGRKREGQRERLGLCCIVWVAGGCLSQARGKVIQAGSRPRTAVHLKTRRQQLFTVSFAISAHRGGCRHHSLFGHRGQLLIIHRQPCGEYNLKRGLYLCVHRVTHFGNVMGGFERSLRSTNAAPYVFCLSTFKRGVCCEAGFLSWRHCFL